MSIAATVLLLFSVAIFLFYYLNRPGRETLQYASGDQSIQFKTSDQTEVVLDKNSTLHIDKGFGKKNRTVYLKGIAEFNIKYDQNLPFIVDAGELWIKELGTKFTVSAKTKSDSIRVDVVKGSVLLYDQKGAELNLKAPDMAYYVKSEKRFFQPATASKTQDINLIFRNEKLEDLINTLIHTYDVEIKLQNPALRNCMVTSSFYNEDLETILLIVTETLGLEFEKSKNGYIIKGETCQP